jgi:pseudouridine kinase
MMTQQELATLLGIERSSVAVHISNLTKKGKIVGRGYVLAKEGRVLVIGGSNMDIIGTSTEALLMQDSNVGKVKIQPGGVGRNIAECLAGLQVPVKLITTLGRDAFGQMIEQDAREKGINTEGILWEESLSTSIYLSLHDAGGDMACALNDMLNIEWFSPEKLRGMEAELRLTGVVVVDANLPVETLDYIGTHVTGKLYAEGVSAHKVLRLKSLLNKIDTLKINRLEAEALTGIVLDTQESVLASGKKLLDYGVRRICITLGADGACLMTESGHAFVKPLDVPIVNTNGAGDALMAGLVFSDINQLNDQEALELAIRCSAQSMGTQGIFPRIITDQIILNQMEV